MTEKSNGRSRKHGLGILKPAVTIGGLCSVLILGPIDSARSVYNQIVGDTPVLKQQLVDYARKGLVREMSENGELALQGIELEQKLGEVLKAKYRTADGMIDSQKTSIHYLWEASENYGTGFWSQFVWPSLND